MFFGPCCGVNLCTSPNLSYMFIVNCVAAECTSPGHIRKRLHFLSLLQNSWASGLNHAQRAADEESCFPCALPLQVKVKNSSEQSNVKERLRVPQLLLFWETAIKKATRFCKTMKEGETQPKGGKSLGV